MTTNLLRASPKHGWMCQFNQEWEFSTYFNDFIEKKANVTELHGSQSKQTENIFVSIFRPVQGTGSQSLSNKTVCLVEVVKDLRLSLDIVDIWRCSLHVGRSCVWVFELLLRTVLTDFEFYHMILWLQPTCWFYGLLLCVAWFCVSGLFCVSLD